MTHDPRWSFFLLVVGAALFVVAPVMAEGSGFSRTAVAVCADGKTDSTRRFPSPDGRSVVIAKIQPMKPPVLTVRRDTILQELSHPAWSCPVFKWAPDSRAVFVTYSTGGAVGQFQTRVYRFTDSAMVMVDPTSAVREDFLATYPRCGSPEEPNFAAVAWLGDSTRLLIAAQVLPHTNCDSMGTFALYEVAVPTGAIAKKYGQLEAKKRFWEELGDELRNANDDCIRDPRSCWVPILHGD